MFKSYLEKLDVIENNLIEHNKTNSKLVNQLVTIFNKFANKYNLLDDPNMYRVDDPKFGKLMLIHGELIETTIVEFDVETLKLSILGYDVVHIISKNKITLCASNTPWQDANINGKNITTFSYPEIEQQFEEVVNKHNSKFSLECLEDLCDLVSKIEMD